MSKYVLRSNKLNGTLLFEYDDQGVIKEFVKDAKMDEHQLAYLMLNFPVTESLLKKQAKNNNWKLSLVDQDLSFDNFWQTYAYKVGNKKRAERLWNALSKANKAKALDYLTRYETFLLQNPSISKLYPETYLNQQRWNN